MGKVKRKSEGGKGVIKRKPATPHIQFPSRKLQKMWNSKKTVAQNYKELGMKLSMNTINRRQSKEINKELDEKEEEELIEEIDDKTPLEPVQNEILDNLDDVAVRKSFKRKIMHEDHQIYCRELYKKYELNYEKMARDSKFNYYQYSSKQLEKKFRWWIRNFANKTDVSQIDDKILENFSNPKNHKELIQRKLPKMKKISKKKIVGKIGNNFGKEISKPKENQ